MAGALIYMAARGRSMNKRAREQAKERLLSTQPAGPTGSVVASSSSSTAEVTSREPDISAHQG
jgi:hypothetical protein